MFSSPENCHRPLRVCHCFRTNCGRGYSGSGFFGSKSFAKRVISGDLDGFQSISAARRGACIRKTTSTNINTRGRIGQDNVLATVRGSEVMADPTAALALEAAVRRRAGGASVRLATTHRVLRLQPLSGEGIVLRHFRLLALVTAGPSEPGNAFETDALVEHAGVHIRLLRRTQASEIRVTVSDAARPAVAERALERLAEAYPDVLVASDPEREHGIGYYAGAMLNVTAYTPAGAQGHQPPATARHSYEASSTPPPTVSITTSYFGG